MRCLIYEPPLKERPSFRAHLRSSWELAPRTGSRRVEAFKDSLRVASRSYRLYKMRLKVKSKAFANVIICSFGTHMLAPLLKI